MQETSMQELLELILKNIVTDPDAVQVYMSPEKDREVYTIVVAPEDMGRVIGKNGKIIRAIRSIGHVIAIRNDKRFRINVAETDEEVEGQQAEPEEETPVMEASEEPVEDTQDIAEEVELETTEEEIAPETEELDLAGAIDFSEDEE